MRVSSLDRASFSLLQQVSAQNVKFLGSFQNYRGFSESRFKFEPEFRFILILRSFVSTFSGSEHDTEEP